MYVNFLLDGAKVKRFHKTILAAVPKVAHPLKTMSHKTSNIDQSFQHMPLLFFVQTDRPPDLWKTQPLWLLYYLLVPTNQIKAGNFVRMTALSTTVPCGEFRITNNRSLLPSKIWRNSTRLIFLHFWTLWGIASETVKFKDERWKRKGVMSSQRRSVTFYIALLLSFSSQFYKELTFISTMRNLTEKSRKMLLKQAQLPHFGRRDIVLRNLGWNCGIFPLPVLVVKA